MGDGAEVRIGCLVCGSVGYYCVSSFETVVVPVRVASHVSDETLHSVGMPVQGVQGG